MEEPKKYHIDTLEKLCNAVNEENVERLAIDLAQWLFFYHSTIKATRLKFPKETKGKKNTSIAKAAFVWIDDGKNDLKGATIENSDTGEITNYNFPDTTPQ